MKTFRITLLLSLISVLVFAQQRQTAPEIDAKPHQQHTMMLLARLNLEEAGYSLNANDIVYAFIEGECRGTASPMPEHEGLIFMNIGEDLEIKRDVSFFVWLDEKQELFQLAETIEFEPLKAIGELHNPFVFKLKSYLGTDNLSEMDWQIGEPYPNPFSNYTLIPYLILKEARINVKIYSSTGILLDQITEFKEFPGKHTFKINGEAYAKGIYLVVFEAIAGNKHLYKTMAIVLQ